VHIAELVRVISRCTLQSQQNILNVHGPRGVGQSVTECVVKALRDVKVTGSKPAGTKNPAMLRVGVAQAGCDPQVILTA
jgi:hypothetical protein